MGSIEWLDESDDPEFSEPAVYVTDANGIVAGPFDDEGEAMWWMEKAKRADRPSHPRSSSPLTVVH